MLMSVVSHLSEVDPLCGNKFGEEGNTNMKSSSSSEVATLLGPVKTIQVVFGYVP